MNFRIVIFISIFIGSTYSCADYQPNISKQNQERKYFTSKGFALVYEENLYKTKIINKKINNEAMHVMHRMLKKNTPIKIINPKNSKFIEGKIYSITDYPKIFNVVISKKIAKTLDLDLDNPYVEIIEIKKNKTFIAKKSNLFDEEKNVATKVPVNEIKMDDLSKKKIKTKKNRISYNSFIILINDFYYENSANDLRNELIKKINTKNILVKKINNNKYRLLAGPFKNFSALKTTYISLNNLGFEDLDIYKN